MLAPRMAGGRGGYPLLAGILRPPADFHMESLRALSAKTPLGSPLGRPFLIEKTMTTSPNVSAESATALAPTGAKQTAWLTLGAIGVVFGDIGTSPLYALKESFVGHHPLNPDPLHIFGRRLLFCA